MCDLAYLGSVSSDSKPRVDKGLRSQQTKRGRGRPRKGDSRTPTSPQKGRKQEDPTTAKKPRGRKKKPSRDKPGSVPIGGDNMNLQPQLCSPQNGEGLLPILYMYAHMVGDKEIWHLAQFL